MNDVSTEVTVVTMNAHGVKVHGSKPKEYFRFRLLTKENSAADEAIACLEVAGISVEYEVIDDGATEQLIFTRNEGWMRYTPTGRCFSAIRIVFHCRDRNHWNVVEKDLA